MEEEEKHRQRIHELRAMITGNTFHDILLYNHAPDIDKGLDGLCFFFKKNKETPCMIFSSTIMPQI
jgi:hypothetical protein